MTSREGEERRKKGEDFVPCVPMHGVSTTGGGMGLGSCTASRARAVHEPGQAAIARELTACIGQNALILGRRKYMYRLSSRNCLAQCAFARATNT